jgi:hypothetical protein
MQKKNTFTNFCVFGIMGLKNKNKLSIKGELNMNINKLSIKELKLMIKNAKLMDDKEELKILKEKLIKLQKNTFTK